MLIRRDESEFAATVDWLYGLRLFGAKLGLEKVRRLAALAGNPQERLRFIHVAGTNGKGSTCAMLESIYRHAGWRTGLFTSPHLVSFRERLQVDRRMIPEADVVRLVEAMKPWLATFSKDSHPTFFEVVAVMALLYFVEQDCQLVIWETGLGGRLDATNIVTPEATVITNIEFDHQEWLGHTLESIAAEKAGIIKPGVPVITGARAGQGLEVIEAAARRESAPMTIIDPGQIENLVPPHAQIGLRGQHQRINAAVAAATALALRDKFPVSPDLIQEGLLRVRWEGRLQSVQTSSGQSVLLDGAHNPSGAATLARALGSMSPAPQALVLGLLQDKDGAGICRLLAPLFPRILAVPIDSERGSTAEVVASLCRQANPQADVRACQSLAEALAQAGPSLVVTGSLHLVGAALEQLGLAPKDDSGERRLNEYSWNIS